MRCRACRLAAHHCHHSALSEWPHDRAAVGRLAVARSLCCSETKPFLETPSSCIQPTVKRIVPVTPRRSFCLQDDTGQIIPRFLMISLLYHICLSRRNARSTGWLGRAKRSRARSHREDAPINSLAVFWEGGCPKEKMDGGCRCFLCAISRVQRCVSDQQPHVSCQLSAHMPALESARLSCRPAVRWLLFTLHMHSRLDRWS